VHSLDYLDGLVIRQHKEWGEIITGFETRNHYTVMDTSGRELFKVAEKGGSVLARWFLKALRPFEIYVFQIDGATAMRIVRPFRFFFHEVSIFDGQGRFLGKVKKRFTFIRRIYTVTDDTGREVFELFGPVFHPWTFEIRCNGEKCGAILKKWSGLLKEAFTDADNFGVSFPADWDLKLKALALGAVFLIDFVHFENTGNNDA